MRSYPFLAALALAAGCHGDAAPKPGNAAPPTTLPATVPSLVPVDTMSRWAPAERATAPASTLYNLEADGDALYWTSAPGLGQPTTLLRLAHGASQPTVVLTAAWIRAFAPSGSDVFVALDDRLVRVAASGGPVTVLADHLPAATVLATPDAIYVATADTRNLAGPSPDPHPGAVVRIPRAGGPPVVLATHASGVPRMALDEQRIYLTGPTGILAMPRDGGAFVELARDEANPPRALALDGDHVYVVSGGELRRFDKAGGPATVLYRAQILLDVRIQDGFVYVSRNLAYDRGQIAETAALVRVSLRGGAPELIAQPPDRPLSTAADARGVYAILSALDPGTGTSDRVVAYAPR
jgi:hypothetical protein